MTTWMEKWIPVEQWDAERVAMHVTDHLFPEQNNISQAEQYRKSFVENAIDGSLLLSLTTDEMKIDLGITVLGHRKKIAQIIDELRQKERSIQQHQQHATENKKRKRETEEPNTQEFVDDEEQERKRLRIEASQERRDFEFATSLAPRQCVICLSEIDVDFIFRLSSCGHDQFCRTCMNEYLIDQVQSRSTCKCPIPDCKVEISRDDLEVLLEKKYIDLYEQFSLESVLTKNPQQYANCFTPGCDYMFFYDRATDTEFQCLKCSKRYCLKCKVEYHAQFTCEQYQQWAVENGLADDMFDEYVEKSDGKPCPSCEHFIERTEGCSHMHCRCGTDFCYQCGQEECECHQR
jgi:hypothetical protein